MKGEGCFTCGDDLADGMEMAQDALTLMLTHLEDEKREIPVASSINAFTVDKDEFVTYISCAVFFWRQCKVRGESNLAGVCDCE